MIDFYLITGCIISSLVLLVGHYFPWHKLLGEPLDRIWAYRYGSGACWVGFSYWRYFGAGDLIAPLGLMIVYIVGGAVVGAAYWLDRKGQAQTIRRRRQSDKFDSPADEIPTVTKDPTSGRNWPEEAKENHTTR